MKIIDQKKAINKTKKVIRSCKTEDQFEVAERMVESYGKNYQDESGLEELKTIIGDMKIKTNSIINWELHQKIMEKKNKFTVCLGVGLNQFFPEYITIDLTPQEDGIIDIGWLEKYSKPKKEKKNKNK